MDKVSRKHIPERYLFDIRLIERNLRDGIITTSELNDITEKLPDSADKAVLMETLVPGLNHSLPQESEN